LLYGNHRSKIAGVSGIRGHATGGVEMGKTLRLVFRYGTVEEVLGMVRRLQTLPEYGKQKADVEIDCLIREITSQERRLVELRERLGEAAGRLLDAVERDWTRGDIYEATGHKPH
jgi:hypothetical protein